MDHGSGCIALAPGVGLALAANFVHLPLDQTILTPTCAHEMPAEFLIADGPEDRGDTTWY